FDQFLGMAGSSYNEGWLVPTPAVSSAGLCGAMDVGGFPSSTAWTAIQFSLPTDGQLEALDRAVRRSWSSARLTGPTSPETSGLSASMRPAGGKEAEAPSA